MELNEVEGQLDKLVANISKVAKTELADKTKAAAMKELSATLKQMKTYAKTRTDLQKRLKEAKSLASDVKKFRSEYSKWVDETAKLATKFSKLNPDTKGRDYFMIANQLGRVGQVTPLDDLSEG